ncbi:hypothetical protein 13VV501A_gene0076 [Vibrio phage 13VV501A]|nr:hypothetical protein 13VV501A_gene0076 [Vibrio phage 13VV501A]
MSKDNVQTIVSKLKNASYSGTKVVCLIGHSRIGKSSAIREIGAVEMIAFDAFSEIDIVKLLKVLPSDKMTVITTANMKTAVSLSEYMAVIDLSHLR